MYLEIQSFPVIMNKIASGAPETEDFEFAALRQANNYRQAVFNEFVSALAGNVLETGCGIGQMTELLRRHPRISHLLCVEPNPEFCSEHRRKFPEIDLLPGTIDSLPAGSAWDAIVSVNVLEHIEEDERELQRYCELLKERCGRLCLIVPARPEIYAPIDRRFGHFRRYTKRSLREKLTAAGFRLEKLAYFNLLGYFAWWTSFRLLKQQRFDPRQVRLFDLMVFPVMNWCETTLFRPPIGQSLVAVALAQ
jgi:SAM-dependent methyltransferase